MNLLNRCFGSMAVAITIAAAAPALAAETDPAILATIDAAIGAINSGSAADLQAVFTEVSGRDRRRFRALRIY